MKPLENALVIGARVRQHHGFWYAVIALGLALAILTIAIGKDVVQVNRQADAALFEQAIENISNGRGAVSNVFANTQNFIERGYAFQSLDELASEDLDLPATNERNILGFHAYYILFALAPFAKVVASSFVLTFAQVACFVGLLALSVLVVHRETVNWRISGVFLFVVVFNPNWAGGIQGQFYPDRLFVLAGFVLCYVAYRQASLVQLSVAALVVASINERAALIGGLILLFIPLCKPKTRISDSRVLGSVLLGVLLLGYAYVQKTFVLSNLYYGSFLPQSIDELVARLALEGFVAKIGVFLAGNLLLMLLSFGAPRLAMLSLLVMLPNIVGNIGGAEKTGWLTHYHSYYFPVLVFAAAVGYAKLSNRFADTRWWRRPNVQWLAVVLVVFVSVGHGRTIGGVSVLHFLQSSTTSFESWANRGQTGYDIKQKISEMFREGSLVVTTELGMAMLHHRVFVSVFPVGLDKADYVFLPCHLLSGRAFSPEWFEGKGFDSRSVRKVDAISYCRLERESN